MKMLPTAALFALLITPLQKAAQWPLWNSYAARFIQGDGRVIDPSREDLTTSEAQGYALFFALVANDRVHYDEVYRWTVDNLANGDIHSNLPAWSWGRRPNDTFGKQDDNSASDADLWIAYDLIQAGRLWHNPKYSSAGRTLLARIATEEVIEAHNAPILLPGKIGFIHDKTYLINPSYLPIFLLQAAARVSPHGPWQGLSASLPPLLHQGSIEGFASDWIELNVDGTVHAAVPLNSKSSHPVGSYDAIRVYLWAGITPHRTPYRNEVLKELIAMADLMKTRPVPPESVMSAPLTFTGDGPLSYSAALVPFLNAVKETEAAKVQMQRLQAAWSAESGLYGDPPLYYDQNLTMFSLGYTEKRYRILPNGDLKVPWTK
jgi:endo-1,4-beta-D-glucanase Y